MTTTRVHMANTLPSFWASILAPLQRIDTTPVWGQVLSAAAMAWTVVTHDMFAGALVLVLISALFDYWIGVKAAKFKGLYDSHRAHAGVSSKMSGILLLMMIRLAEFWGGQHVLLNTKGAIATAVAISLFAVDVQSISHHREEMGASPIPVLGRVIALLQGLASSKVPGPPTDDSK